MERGKERLRLDGLGEMGVHPRRHGFFHILIKGVALMAMMGMGPAVAFLSRRINFVAVSPSMTGIRMSIKIVLK